MKCVFAILFAIVGVTYAVSYDTVATQRTIDNGSVASYQQVKIHQPTAGLGLSVTAGQFSMYNPAVRIATGTKYRITDTATAMVLNMATSLDTVMVSSTAPIGRIMYVQQSVTGGYIQIGTNDTLFKTHGAFYGAQVVGLSSDQRTPYLFVHITSHIWSMNGDY
jgi:hypothetical protein